MKLFLSLLLLIIYNVMSAQSIVNYASKNIDSIAKIDFINKKYKYLNDNFNVKMDSGLYKQTFTKHKFYTRKQYTKNDSITIALIAEFGENDFSRIAKIHICYTWLRMAYHLILNKETTESLGKKLGFSHPFLFNSWLRDETKNANKSAIIDNLKKRIQAASPTEKLEGISNIALLNIGLKVNPERIADYNNLISKTKK